MKLMSDLGVWSVQAQGDIILCLLYCLQDKQGNQRWQTSPPGGLGHSPTF